MTMDISGDFPNGIKWYGTKGWIFVTRDEMTTPTATAGQTAKIEPLMASDPRFSTRVIGPNEMHLYQSDDQHGNWLDCIKTRKAPTAPAEIGHRACSTCLLHHIAMKTKRHLHWDPVKERFINDDAANAMLSRPQRAPYVMSRGKFFLGAVRSYFLMFSGGFRRFWCAERGFWMVFCGQIVVKTWFLSVTFRS